MTYPFLQAAHITAGENRPINRIVIHDEEYPVGVDSAENVAQFFHNPPSSTTGSAHACTDADGIMLCAYDNQIVWAAPPNPHSYNIEQDGYARFTAEEWNLPGSLATMKNTAKLTREKCLLYGIPMVWLSVADLLAGKRGVTSHNNVTLAWHESTHTDPGPGFPIAEFMAMVNSDPNTPTTGGLVMDAEVKARFDHLDAILTGYYVDDDDENAATPPVSIIQEIKNMKHQLNAVQDTVNKLAPPVS